MNAALGSVAVGMGAATGAMAVMEGDVESLMRNRKRKQGQEREGEEGEILSEHGVQEKKIRKCLK